MTGRIIKYSEPVEFHKAMPGAKSIVIMKRYDDGIPEGFTPPKRKKIPKVRNAHNEPIDDEIGKPAEKGNSMTYDYDTSRGPYHAILDKMARARQAITGESYAKAFTETYCDPKNAAIRDGSKYDDLAKAYDGVYGTSFSLVKAAPPDPPQDEVSPGPAHDEFNALVAAHMKANPTLSREQSFTRIYTSPDHRNLKARVDAESVLHAQRRASAPPFPPYRSPGQSGPSNLGRSGAKPAGYAGG
jgi:hypothetical protein